MVTSPPSNYTMPGCVDKKIDGHYRLLFVYDKMVWFLVFHATFNNISVISWWSVLLVEETGVPGENH